MVANTNSSYQYGVRKNIYKSALTSLYNKKIIWNQLKIERRLHQRNKALTKNRFTSYKKIHTIDNIQYYKVIDLGHDYYIEVASLTYTSSFQFVVQLCYYTINGMKYKQALLKIEQSKDEIFISENTLSIAYNSCKLESIS